MDFSNVYSKKRKIEQSNNEVEINHQNIKGEAFLFRFLDRLKLKSIPHISPLLERLSDAESKNASALKSIDAINKRIKELEFNVGKRKEKVLTSSTKQGTDLTDNNSEEFMIITNSLKSSPLTPFKPPASQAIRQNGQIYNERKIVQSSQETYNPKNNSNNNNRQNKVIQINQNNMKANLLNLDIVSAKFLPSSSATKLMSNPRLTWVKALDGISLQWNVSFIDPRISPVKYEISSFQKSEITLNHFPWRKIGEVAALPLPMACTLTYVAKLNTYFFAIRAWFKDDVSSAWSNVVMVET